MGAYSKHVALSGNPAAISSIGNAIRTSFLSDGFEVNLQQLYSGAIDISITKGGMFKAVLGMQLALKITLTPQPNGVVFDANVGVFGQQFIPTVISMLFFWPVLITQIWGLVQQSKLDDKALIIAQQEMLKFGTTSASTMTVSNGKFCPNCGNKLEQTSAKFCPNCGTAL